MEAQDLRHLVAAAGFICRGSVMAHETRNTPAIPATAGEMVAVRIEEVLRSTAAMRSLAGREAHLITKHASALRQMRDAVLFTQCISLGEELLLRELGHVEATGQVARQVAEAIHETDERPLRDRVASAVLIVGGEVVDSRPLARSFPPRSEHDPLWSIARVVVTDVLKGHKPHGEVEVLYAESDDIAWFRSPKLHAGVNGILLLFHLNEAEVPKEVPRSVYQATDPLDFQPYNRRGEIERLLGGEKRAS